MNKYFKKILNFRIVGTSPYVLIKTIFLGIIFTETWFFSQFVAQCMSNDILANNYEYYVFAIEIIYIILLVIYLSARDFFTDVVKIIKSKRIDILIALCLGIWIDIIWGSFLFGWYKNKILLLNFQQLLTLVFIPFILGLILIGKSIFLKKKTNIDSVFVSDLEVKTKKDDLLDFTEKADRFAERVFNNGSSESFVFGIDAPWGIGKSTFINFCEEYWHDHHKNNVIVYKFSPLRYAGDAKLSDVFIDGLINAIQKDSFAPEIVPLISRYSRLLKEVSRFSFLGFNIPTFSVNYSIDDAFNDLCAVLQHFHKKVVVIVDDLDRIDFLEIKNVLFVIRKSFALPNVSYVLCYDTENIGILEAESPDIDKVSEFLEKFVNIKISLFLDKEYLVNYVSKNLEKNLSNKLVDPILVGQAIGGLLDIYKSAEYHKYLPFIGDIRKLKRLINTIVLFELHLTNFNNSDFDKRDLIHLLLIYIHYPNIFRKIYDTETNGGRGFFSVVTPYDDNYPKEKRMGSLVTVDNQYENSREYTSYLEQFPKNSNQRFLLDQVFNLSNRTKDLRIDSVPDDLKTSLACFNGGWGNGRNLEEYLNLIINLSKPEEIGQHKFYVNWKEKIFNGSLTIQEVIGGEAFNYNKGDQIREKLWRIIINNTHELNTKISESIITHLLENIHTYPLLKIQGVVVGFRHDLDYLLTRLLDDVGWSDKSSKHRDNTEENIKEIAEWIFGENKHIGNGVLEKLSSTNYGVLGLYDLMVFRLFCSTDRGGDIFNLTRALLKHENEKAPTEGNTRNIAREEMREISQKVFDIFKKQYIDLNKNIFEEMEKIQLKDLAGEYEGYIKSKIETKDVNNKIESLKSKVLSFIVYQLGNDLIDLGVGCGFYDPIGNKDEHKIKEAINNYLFNFCFNPEKERKNYEYFIDYLFRNYASAFVLKREDGKTYLPRISEFTKVLDKTMLINYWWKHADIIKGLNLNEKEKQIFIDDYVVTYKDDLEKLYESLDKLILEQKLSTSTVGNSAT